MSKLTNTDISEVIDGLRSLGYSETDVQPIVEGLEDGIYSISDVADFLEAMEEGDDDEAFLCACYLGLA